MTSVVMAELKPGTILRDQEKRDVNTNRRTQEGAF